MWEIKGKDNQVKATVGSLEYNGEWMGESYVTVTVESPAPVNFEIGDYIIYRDERFEINYDPGKIKSAPRYAKGDAFKYENIKFNSLADELTRCDFLDIVLNDNQLHFTGLPKFSFYGGVKDLANRMQANLDRTYGKGTWSVVVSPEFQSTKEVNISVDTIKVQGALSILVNDLETYYTIKGRTITIGAAGIPAGHLFKYGKGNGLYEIEQNAEADQAIVTRLRAYGSTRNLPHRYYNSLSGADGKKLIPDNMAVQYLMLPEFPYTTQDPYIDSPNIAKLGIREGTVFFDGSGELEEIYPSIEGMTAEQLKAAGVPCNSTGALDEIVSAEQMTDNGVGEINEGETQTTAKPPTFKVTLKDLGFDINDHKTTETATISFKTGMLGGRDFEIVGCKKIESSGKVTGYELELNRVYDDSIKLWFPYKDYNAKGVKQNPDNPDKFVILHIEMPEVYIKAAAQRLKEAATEWLSKNDYSRSIYAPKVDEIFMARQHDLTMASGGKIKSLHDTLKEGMLLLFEDEDLNIDASIFIDRLTIKEEGAVPTYEVVLKEEKTVGRLDKMQNQIDSLVAGKGQGGGGYTAAQIRSMIDAYGGTRFLSKLKDDRSAGKIASDMGFEIGNYLAGVSGGMFGIEKESGNSFAEVFRLFVRGKAYFETLTIIEANTLAGKQYITPGGSIKCSKVEVIKDETDSLIAYRCYFLSEQDGEKTETKIIVGDQAISEMFNAKAGADNKVSNHRYWRLVTSVNNDAYTDGSGNHYGYIDLSPTDCETNSDIPKEGDIIDQLGNRTDRTRQAAMIFSTVDSDAPSIKLLTGIGSGDTNDEHYSLVGKDIISQGYDPIKGHAFFKCYGDAYIGDPDGSTYIDYNQDTNELTAKLRLSLQSPIGDKTLGDLLDGYDASDYLRKALPQNTDIIGGVMLSTMLSLGYNDEAGLRHTLAGMNGAWIDDKGGRTIAAWYGGDMIDAFDYRDTLTGIITLPPDIRAATSLFRMDGTGYLSKGSLWWDDVGNLFLGSGITVSGDGYNATLASILNAFNGLNALLVPIDEEGQELDWKNAVDAVALKARKNFCTEGELSVLGWQSGNEPGVGLVTALSDLTDVKLTGLAVDDLIRWDGKNWVNVKASELGIGGSVDLTAYLKVNGSNATNLGVSAMIRALSPASAALTDATLIVTSEDTGQTDVKPNYYRRSAPAFWAYIQGKSDNRYVTALGTSGNYVSWTKNGMANNITVPYATYSRALNGIYTGSGGFKDPSYFVGKGLAVNMMNVPETYCDIIYINGYNSSGGSGYDVPGINALAFRKTTGDHGSVWHTSASHGSSNWGTWHKFLDTYNYASTLDARYVKKAGDEMSGKLTAPSILLLPTFSSTDSWVQAFCVRAGVVAGKQVYYNFGVADGLNNSANINFHYAGDRSTSNYIGFGFASNNNLAVLLASGSVLIGTTTNSSGAKLHVVGNVYSTGDMVSASSSDRRLKHRFAVEDYSARILRLGAVMSYEWSDKARMLDPGKYDMQRHNSVVWQRARKTGIPGFCGIDDRGYGYINWLNKDYQAVLLGAVQETIRVVHRHDDEIMRLRRRVSELEEMVNNKCA